MKKSIYGPTNPKQDNNTVRKVASLIELKPEKELEYRQLHVSVWPEVQQIILECNIRNYSIFIAPLNEKTFLFSYFEYVGDNWAKDNAMMHSNPTIQKWWDLTKPCQTRIENTPDGEQWLELEKVFHLA